MDNTLFDFVEAKIRACRAVTDCLEIEHSPERKDLLEYFVKGGKGIENLENIADYLKDRGLFNQNTFDKCSEVYMKTKIENIIPYDGVEDTLQKLKAMNLKLAVVTDADIDNARLRLKITSIMNFFDQVVPIEYTGKKKPEPDSIQFALNLLNVEPNEAVLVGDSLRRDIEPGRNLGMITVYAAYGDKNFFEEKKGTADYLINEISELIAIINQNKSKY
jgi:putative hydrolase of the HAD superfamily